MCMGNRVTTLLRTLAIRKPQRPTQLGCIDWSLTSEKNVQADARNILTVEGARKTVERSGGFIYHICQDVINILATDIVEEKK